MSLSQISKTRSQIMGIAMILIVVFHTDIVFSYTLYIVKNFCDFGVNIFFCLSGFSMCYAWAKNKSVTVFYKRRFLRIFVTVLPISIVWNIIAFLMHENTISEAILKTLTIQFWIDANLYQWFVSGILILYLITPIVMILYDKNSVLGNIVVASISILAIICGLRGYRLIFMERVPSYFMGIVIGKCALDNIGSKKTWNIVFGVLQVIGVICLALIKFDAFNYSYKYLIYSVLTVPAVLLLAFLFDTIKWSGLNVALSFCGGITLEVYILQEKILKVANMVLGKIHLQLDGKHIVINLLVIAGTIVIATVYSRLVAKVIAKFNR